MIRAWHFCGATLRDGRPIPPDGEWLTHDGPAVMCESGLHASRHPSDALSYAPGPILCLVECEGIVEEHDDKLVCRRRRIVKRLDATELLKTYARKCALSVIHLWDAPAIVRDYLETGDETKRAAAWGAARVAAWAAARGAAGAAAWGAAGDAERAAARVAARVAAGDAAGAAAWVAAGAAAGAVYLADFDAMVDEAFRGTP